MPIDVHRKLLKWGNGFGLRLTAKEVAALGIREGQPVHATLARDAELRSDFSMLPLFQFHGRSQDLDELRGEELDEKHDRIRRTAPGPTRRKASR